MPLINAGPKGWRQPNCLFSVGAFRASCLLRTKSIFMTEALKLIKKEFLL